MKLLIAAILCIAIPMAAGASLQEAPVTQAEPSSTPARAVDVDSLSDAILRSYPLEAVTQGKQGSVSVKVTIDTEGRARECAVTDSSGYRVLDESACEVMRESARFEAATDAQGRKVESTLILEIRYALPDDDHQPATPLNMGVWYARVQAYPPSLDSGASGMVVVFMGIDENGRVSGCSILESSGYPTLDEEVCRAVKQYARFNPAIDADGNPTDGAYGIGFDFGD